MLGHPPPAACCSGRPCAVVSQLPCKLRAQETRTRAVGSSRRLESPARATLASRPTLAASQREAESSSNGAQLSEHPNGANGAGGRPALQRLHKASDSLRALLERRAQREQQRQQVASVAPLPIRPSAPEVPAEVAPLKRTVKTRFWLKFHAEWGQRIKVVGSQPDLGNWMLSNAAELKWSENDMWHATVDVPAGSIVEYKYVVLDSSGTHAVAWQRGNNAVLALRGSEAFVEVFDNWNGDPGSKVVADGAAPVTRENRLLSWAAEVEAQMAAQRGDLRRARMELVAAQEDAKLAREEAARSRRELALSEAERATTVSQLRVAEGINQVLQTRLLDTTQTFRQALEVAAHILRQIDDGSEGTDGSGSGEQPLPPKRPQAEARAHAEPAATAAEPEPAAGTSSPGTVTPRRSRAAAPAAGGSVDSGGEVAPKRRPGRPKKAVAAATLPVAVDGAPVAAAPKRLRRKPVVLAAAQE